MSFVTKRERVFNEYDLFDLPARNEGKLKAYASCTDARAWSHFCSDKSEHLVEVIKRNNETVRPKYLPTNVIVDTLMVAKNAEIARLKRKIEEFEQMLTAYDQLELSCDQKSEIAHAHAAIKAANKELDELFLDLDLSGYTEGVDSEGFETGKSRGDEATPKTNNYEDQHSPNKYSKGVQNEYPCTCDVATLVKDQRIAEMQDTIITKDAKLNAMRNTIAVMENDVCEPYCIYAHIYTALEKIFGILCQNDKYRQYLKLLTAGKDIRCIDIKGRILFKLKVLERFCCALIAPCTQDLFAYPKQNSEDHVCYRVDLSESRIQPSTTFALTSAETKSPNLDNKRAHLVADIIQNDEIKEILSRESSIFIPDEEQQDEVIIVDNLYNIDKENLRRLKSLQANYDDLMTCYETLKHEKDSLEKRCHNGDEIEKANESLKEQMLEYNSLWNEKEHFRKRSADLDSLKEQYLILTDETSSLETQLKAEGEINHIKSKAMEGLRSENISLEKHLNESRIAFEKDKNVLMCKLKEAECRVMCQEQQIKSLLQQIDKLLDQDQEKTYSPEPENRTLTLLDEIESLKEQILNLKDALHCNQEEKQDIQKHYQNHLELINELKLEIEDWKSMYEKTLQRNDYLEKYNESLIEEARHSNQDLDDKSNAVDNLINVIKNKSQEINKLMQDIEKERDQNRNLYKQLNELRDRFDSSLVSLENEKMEAIQSLQVARQESQELLDKVKDYDQVVHKKADVTKSLEQQLLDNKELQNLVMTTLEENRKLKMDLDSLENNNTLLQQEIQRLREVNEYADKTINRLIDQKKQYEMSLDLTMQKSSELENKMMDYENLTHQLENYQNSHGKLIEEKMQLENKLLENSFKLENALHSINLSKKESEEIIDKLQQSGGSKDNELSRIRDAYQKLSSDKYAVQKALMEKNRDMDNLQQTLNNLKLENEQLLQKCGQVDGLLQELEGLKKDFAELSNERNILEANKTEEYNHLYNTLENKIEENGELMRHIKSLETKQTTATNAIETLQGQKMMTESKLNLIRNESAELMDKIKHYETLEIEYENLKRVHDEMAREKENLQTELNKQLADLRRMEQENSELHSHSQNLLTHSEDLENALIGARTELIKKSSGTFEPYKDIMDEIEVMRQEKLQNQKKIMDLLYQLDEAENIKTNLVDDVLARDGKIATLQNQINELEEEVFRLHSSLDEVISTGEQMKDFSLQNIEAHHSKATHNMKIELAKLQHDNFMLSEQLSVTKIKSDESLRNNYQYASQINTLQKEREIIVTDIKQLELESVGDTALGPNNCNVEDILESLDRIRKSFKARTTRSSSLERTLLKVQTSSQLLLSKADEAKKIVEREKQKIISEKEDAIIDKQNMETELFELKNKYEKQIANYKNVIENLERTILNQNLIADKVNKSTKEYISKLNEELQTLKDLYQNSVIRISEMQEKLQSMTEDKSHLIVMVEEIKVDLGKKSNEVAELQKQLEALKLKENSYRSVEAQTYIDNYQNMESQTDTETLPVETNKVHISISSATMDNTKEKNVDTTTMVEVNKLPLESHNQLEIKLENPFLVNEVQILSTTVEEPFDLVKTRYINYKMNKLSTGRLEHYSFTCISDKEKEKSKNNTAPRSPSRKLRKSGTKSANSNGNNLIDIFNRVSIDSTSSKINDESENITTGKIASQNQDKSIGYAATLESYERQSKTYEGSSSGKSTDKDLFIIYKDSDNSSNNHKEESKKTWSGKGHPDIVIEAVSVHPTKNGIGTDMNGPEEDSFIFEENDENFIGNSLQHKLKIKLPRVTTESDPIPTASDIDKKSFDSYYLALNSSPKQFSDLDTKFYEDLDGKTVMVSLPTISNDDNQYLGSYNSLRQGLNEDSVRPRKMKNKSIETDNGISKHIYAQIPMKMSTISSPIDNESHHKLSRVGADVLLLEAEQDQNIPHISMRQNFGLEYIRDTVQGEVSPDAENYFAATELRKTKSDERFNVMKIRERTDSSPSRLSEYKVSSTEYKNILNNSQYNEKRPQKSYTERSIMAKLDVNNDYEIQINTLTRALEHIEKDYKKKIKAIKMQYDSNIKSIINEHNQGVKSIQNLHEDTLQDMIKFHESEVENLRTMSIEAMRKADKLEKENRALKIKAQDLGTTCLDEEPIKMTSPEINNQRKCRGDTRMLTKTNVEAFNVKPKTRLNGPCTCSIDVNVSDTICNIFEQVDAEQRQMAENTYLKYIANKILNGNVEDLDAQELSFLHLKVCRTWKTKQIKEVALQKRIDSLENELMSKQRNAQQHIAELDRKVAEERRRLQEVREAVCRRNPASSRASSPNANAEKDACGCINKNVSIEAGSRPSAGDLAPKLRATFRRTRPESHRATLARLDAEDRRERKLTYNDEPPTRLRRSHDRQPLRFPNKK